MVDRPDRGQREHIRLEVAKIVPPLIFEDVIGDAVGRVERAPVDRRERRQILLGGGLFGGDNKRRVPKSPSWSA